MRVGFRVGGAKVCLLFLPQAFRNAAHNGVSANCASGLHQNSSVLFDRNTLEHGVTATLHRPSLCIVEWLLRREIITQTLKIDY